MIKVKIRFVDTGNSGDLKILLTELSRNCKNSRIIRTKFSSWLATGTVVIITKDIDEIMGMIYYVNCNSRYPVCILSAKTIIKACALRYNKLFPNGITEVR